MWVLLIVTLLPQIDDAKVVRYDVFKSEKTCEVVLKQIEKTFENNEQAFCEYSKIVKK